MFLIQGNDSTLPLFGESFSLLKYWMPFYLHRHWKGYVQGNWRLQVSMERGGRHRHRGLFSSSRPPTGSWVSTKNLLMREWLSLALHFPVCVSRKYKWRSSHRQVCQPMKLPARKICKTIQWKALMLCLYWQSAIHKCSLVLYSSYHFLWQIWKVFPRTQASWLYHMYCHLFAMSWVKFTLTVNWKTDKGLQF